MITPQDQKEIAALELPEIGSEPGHPDNPVAIEPRPLTSADFAKLIKRNEELRQSVESAINWLDLRHPIFAKSELLRALGRKVE